MKTQHIDPVVLEAWKARASEQQAALALATDAMQTWESLEQAYKAGGKSAWSPTMKLRLRRIAVSTLKTIDAAKSQFTDAEAWLEAWTKAGQKRLAEFAAMGVDVEPFTPSLATNGPTVMPGAKSALLLMEQAHDHLAEIVWDDELSALAREAKEL